MMAIHQLSKDAISDTTPIHKELPKNPFTPRRTSNKSIDLSSPQCIVRHSKHNGHIHPPGILASPSNHNRHKISRLASPICTAEATSQDSDVKMEEDNDNGRVGCGGEPLDVEMIDLDTESERVLIDVRNEWIGTSQFLIEQSIALQYEGRLDILISYRSAVVHHLKATPYDPTLYIDLSQVDTKLGFCDIALANAHRGLILVKAGLAPLSILNIFRSAVRDVISQKHKTTSAIIVDDELSDLHLKMYREYINAFLGMASFWDGLIEVREALRLFPRDPDLLGMCHLLKQGFMDRHHLLQSLGGEGKDLKMISRMGKIYQKAYPWLDSDLNIRTSDLLKRVNATVGAENCQVRRVNFGPLVFGPEPPARLARGRTTYNTDVGPLGIFATRHIKKGEIIMADKCLTGISQVPSSRREHCDACHASLSVPFVHPNEIITPTCCGKVAYCSRECYLTALKTYHRIICGKNIDWLFENLGAGEHDAGDTRWRPIMFLRVIAIVIQDRELRKSKGKPPVHPLQHHLVARMAANYASPEKHHPDVCSDWQFFENISAPTRIMLELGIDIFNDSDFSHEVIQTIYWRMENNANMSTFNLNPLKPVGQAPLDKSPRAMLNLSEKEEEIFKSKGTVHMICLNPNYLFFNHSCEPNVNWHGSIPDPSVGIEWLRGINGEIQKPGSSVVFCKAVRDIRKGEELKISYVGDPMVEGLEARKQNGKGKVINEGSDGEFDEEKRPSKAEIDRREARVGKRKWLEKWFDGGCGCRVCQEENEVMALKKKKQKSKEGERHGEIWNKLYQAV